MISVDPKALLAALRIARLCAASQSSRTTYTALYGVRTTYSAGDNFIKLASTDLRHSIEVLVPVIGGDNPFDMVVMNPALLAGICSNSNVNIGLIPNGKDLAVESGKSRSRIACESGANFPITTFAIGPATQADAVLTPENIKTLVGPAFAADRSRNSISVLANTLITVDEGITTLTATNNVHAATSKVTSQGEQCRMAVVPTFAWDIVLAFASEVEKVAIFFDEQRVRFIGAHSNRAVVFYSIQTVNVMYPDVNALRPIAPSDPQIVVDTKTLKKYFEGVRLLADKSIEVDILDNVLCMGAAGDAGSSGVSLDGQSCGTGTIKVSAESLIQEMHKIEGERTALAIAKGRLKIQSNGMLYVVGALSH